jgi:lipoprotein-anchoring transpeptidase ErfK/SrfK
VATRRLAIVVVAAAIGAAGVAGAATGGRGRRSPAPAPRAVAAAAAGVPEPARPAFAVPAPRLLQGAAAGSRWAPVRRATVARAGPRADAPAVARVAAGTPEGTTNLVVVVGEAERGGRTWDRVRLATLPNGRLGWVPRRALGGYHFVHTRLVVDRARLEVTLLRGGTPVFRAPAGVGRPASPTPPGVFYVRDRVTSLHDPFYGPVAFGTSARSAALTEWPGGGFIGIHGTDRPDLLPGRVSHGCIRMRNADIVRLARLMPIGTPVVVR